MDPNQQRRFSFQTLVGGGIRSHRPAGIQRMHQDRARQLVLSFVMEKLASTWLVHRDAAAVGDVKLAHDSAVPRTHPDDLPHCHWKLELVCPLLK